MSDDEAKDWGNGYLMGYALSDYLSQKENRTYLTITKSFIRNDAWKDMCTEVIESLIRGIFKDAWRKTF